MESWKRWASCVTTPTASCRDCWVTSRRSVPAIRTAPSVGSYMRVASWDIVVLPAPDGPTSATVAPAGTVKLRFVSVSCVGSLVRAATDSRDASDTSDAVG